MFNQTFWLLIAFSIVAVLPIAIVDAKPKVCKKIANGQAAIQFPDLYDYFKTIGYGVYESRFTDSVSKNQTQVIEKCTGFFVQVKPSDVNSNCKNNSITKVFYVSAAHCYPSYTPERVVVDNVTHNQVLLFANISIRFGFNLYNTTQSRYLNIDVTQNPIRISKGFTEIIGLMSCSLTHDLAIVELSQSDIAIVKESHGKFVDFQNISYSNGMSGENCWIAGFGGTTHDSKLQLMNVTFYEDNSCFKDFCNTEANRMWQFCYKGIKGSEALSEGGDSGSPVWCLRDGVHKVVGVHNSQHRGIGFVANPPAVGTRAERLTEMLLYAYKHGL